MQPPGANHTHFVRLFFPQREMDTRIHCGKKPYKVSLISTPPNGNFARIVGKERNQELITRIFRIDHAIHRRE